MTDSMTGMARFGEMDIIVGLAVLFAVVFLCAWLYSPRLRQRVDRPKFRFQADVERYDGAQQASSTLKERKPR